ncbi:MAG: XdhC family protein [Acidobacteria bacterium]|nr:XdhC family protein [Acidobacteriota bacterium]
MLTNDLLLQLNQTLSKDKTAILLTIISIDSLPSNSNISIANKRLLLNDGKTIGSLGDSSLDLAIEKEIQLYGNNSSINTITLWTDKLQNIDNADFVSNVKINKSAKVRILIEFLRPQPSLLICGAGHIARALTQLATVLGFRVTVIDDRVEFAHRDYFPDPNVELKAEGFEQAIKSIDINSNMSVVIVTRGHKHDEDCLRLLLNLPIQYLGMIGSRRRVTVVKEKLKEEGFCADQLAKLYAPIGLDIGAKTPEELALTILAEIVLVRNRGLEAITCHPLSRLTRIN